VKFNPARLFWSIQGHFVSSRSNVPCIDRHGVLSAMSNVLNRRAGTGRYPKQGINESYTGLFFCGVCLCVSPTEDQDGGASRSIFFSLPPIRIDVEESLRLSPVS